MKTIIRYLVPIIFAFGLFLGLAAPAAAAPAQPVIETVEQFAASNCWLNGATSEYGSGDLYVFGEKNCSVSTTGRLTVSLYGPYNGNFLGSTSSWPGGGYGSAAFTRYCTNTSAQNLYTVVVRFTDNAGRSISRSIAQVETVAC